MPHIRQSDHALSDIELIGLLYDRLSALYYLSRDILSSQGRCRNCFSNQSTDIDWQDSAVFPPYNTANYHQIDLRWAEMQGHSCNGIVLSRADRGRSQIVKDYEICLVPFSNPSLDQWFPIFPPL
jgi:hypothetical protein